jgi:hypothetical protein
MNIVELRHALSTLRLGGIASTIEARLRLAIGRGGGVTGACLGFRPLAGFQLTAFGRISSDR